MQYKIPIQLENEDKIIFGLSFRQLGILLVGGMISYLLFTRYQGLIDTPILTGIAVMILAIFFLIAKFRVAEMTFLPYLLNLARMKINGTQRMWSQGVDSYSGVRLGYVKTGKKTK